MSVKVTGRFIGNKKIELTHNDSGVKLVTSAPKDNNGDGSSFSPTDLVGASMGSCMMTIMAILAEREGIDLTGMWMDVEKHMATEGPRRIARLPLNIHLPARLDSEQRQKMERAAMTCPVHKSLHPDVKTEVLFCYDV